MQRDVFTSTTGKQYLHENSNPEEVNLNDNNFFLHSDATSSFDNKSVQHHINDYDYNLLKEDAYKDVADDTLKLEYQISKIEETIVSLDKQIKAAKEIRDFELAESLFEKQKSLQNRLNSLTAVYKNSSLSAKISGNYSAGMKAKINNIKNSIIKSLENFVIKIPGKLSSTFELKNSLDKLENINKSVNELMSMQIPYGEANHRYETLSKYIVKANSIQMEISKFLK